MKKLQNPASITTEEVIPALVEFLSFLRVFIINILSYFFDKEDKIHCSGRTWFGNLGIGPEETKKKGIHLFSFFKPDDISILSLGCGHCLVLCSSKQKGKVFGWGKNGSGQVGTGDTSNQDLPIEIPFFQGKAVEWIACGAFFSLCLTFERGFAKKIILNSSDRSFLMGRELLWAVGTWRYK